METINSYEGWIGTDAYDVNGDKIGDDRRHLLRRPDRSARSGWPSAPASSG